MTTSQLMLPLFRARSARNNRLWIKNLETGRQQRLTRQNDHFEFYPAFSRDGRWLVYTSWDDQQLGHVRIVAVDGSRSARNLGGVGFELALGLLLLAPWLAGR